MFGAVATRETREELASIMSDFHPDGFRLMARALAESDTRGLLPNIEAPTLLIWGDADARSPVAVAQQFRDAIPGAQLAILSGAGHVSNLEAPKLFDAEVRRFCQSASHK
jgi:pimeloyl-ACP methyl ester carboxylesterase